MWLLPCGSFDGQKKWKDWIKAKSLYLFNMIFSSYFAVCYHINIKPSLSFFAVLGIENLYERALYIRKILLTIPRSVLIVMRYLFAFLNQ